MQVTPVTTPLPKREGAGGGSRLVIKIGSNVLTRADGKLDVTRMSALVDQVAWLRQQGYEVILVSSGAVACGRRELQVEHELGSVEQRQLFSALGQVKLIGLYYDLFREFHIHVGQVLTMKENFEPGEQFENQRACMRVMLENGVLPIVNENDTVCVTELMFTDNDELSGLIAQMMEADTLILLSNIDGIYTGHPDDPQSQLIRTVAPGTDLSQYIRTEKSAFGRGGMHSKYTTASQVQAAGIRVIIANGERENILIDLMERPEQVPFTEFMTDSPREGRLAGAETADGNKADACSVDFAPSLTGRAGRASARMAAKSLALLSDEQRNTILLAVADAIVAQQERILKANAEDLLKMDPSNPLYDRLQLTPSRLEGIAADMRNVASLPSPLGHITKEKTLPNGLRLCRVSVPFGVIGMIYEARPNVTFDVFSLCFKSGNACVLKGGRDADCSNREAVALIHEVLRQFDISTDVVTLLPATHEATAELLNAVGDVDLCIPRGGRRLIDFVRDHARIPVIETGAGVVNTYFDIEGDVVMGTAIIHNAKTRRVSVCNALDTLLIHEARLADLPELVAPMAASVTLYADEQAFASLDGHYPTERLQHATPDSFGTEYMDYKLAVKTVKSLDEALTHIDAYGSGHSEAIITNNAVTAQRFQTQVDAACVYWNAPTSFTDGAQFGLGAEIGISTQKLHARGPMALEEITTYKWLIHGEGQVRG